MNNSQAALQNAKIASWGQLNSARLEAIYAHAYPKILDVGSSSGKYVNQLRAKGFNAVGVDLLADPAWCEDDMVRNGIANATQLPFATQAVDTIISFEVLEHIPNVDQALQEFHRVTRKNIIVSVPNCDVPDDVLNASFTYSPFRDPTHCNFFTTATLQTRLENAGFAVKHIYPINFARPEYLLLRSYHVPERLAAAVARVASFLPFRKKYGITLLAVADKT
jgi:2-polyprenyl-3-methyl-5-hydroxy-6-metoxy-1,4-benzoquinol methylase